MSGGKDASGNQLQVLVDKKIERIKELATGWYKIHPIQYRNKGKGREKRKGREVKQKTKEEKKERIIGGLCGRMVVVVVMVR